MLVILSKKHYYRYYYKTLEMLYSIRHLVNMNSIDNELNLLMMFNLFLIKTYYLKCLL